MELWHGSRDIIEGFDPAVVKGEGFHFGTRSQAEMRNSAFLHRVSLDLGRLRRCRDDGGPWKARVARARRDGVSGIIYLNRFEGLSADDDNRLHESGVVPETCPDRIFRRHAPSAADSVIAWDPGRIRILEVVAGRGRVPVHALMDAGLADELMAQGFVPRAHGPVQGYSSCAQAMANARPGQVVATLWPRACDLGLDLARRICAARGTDGASFAIHVPAACVQVRDVAGRAAPETPALAMSPSSCHEDGDPSREEP